MDTAKAVHICKLIREYVTLTLKTENAAKAPVEWDNDGRLYQEAWRRRDLKMTEIEYELGLETQEMYDFAVEKFENKLYLMNDEKLKQYFEDKLAKEEMEV